MLKKFLTLGILTILVLIVFSGQKDIGGAEEYNTMQNCPNPYEAVDLKMIQRWPLDTLEFTQHYSWGHPAVDLRAYKNQEIYSVGYGFVSFKGASRNENGAFTGYGWHVIIDHPEGFKTLYAHMNSEPPVEVGEYVYPGKLIGYAGSTGQSTGVHVHFEILQNECYKDPEVLVN